MGLREAGLFFQSQRMSTEPAIVAPKTARIASIDALRGFVMFTMIFVNDLAGAPKKVVPDWMVHFSDRHKHGSGMTFVDLVFPGFLFIVGMSIPIAARRTFKQGRGDLENLRPRHPALAARCSPSAS